MLLSLTFRFESPLALVGRTIWAGATCQFRSWISLRECNAPLCEFLRLTLCIDHISSKTSGTVISERRTVIL